MGPLRLIALAEKKMLSENCNEEICSNRENARTFQWARRIHGGQPASELEEVQALPRSRVPTGVVDDLGVVVHRRPRQTGWGLDARKMASCQGREADVSAPDTSAVDITR